MRKSFMAAGAAALIASVASCGSALADETGIAVIHAWVSIGNKTCFADRYHYGSGRSQTQNHARAAAVNSWIWPTALEYGGSWADDRLAASKTMSCAPSGSGWTCDTRVPAGAADGSIHLDEFANRASRKASPWLLQSCANHGHQAAEGGRNARHFVGSVSSL